MKKTILSILAGATMLSSVAAASPSIKIDATDLVLPTGDQVISDLYNQNVGGINNVELSKYEQAWMIVHEKDTLFKHKTFYVRTGKVFTGIPVDSIKDLTKSERSEFIMDSVKKSVVEAALKDQKEALEAKHAEAIADLSKVHASEIQAAAAVVADLASQIEDLAKGIKAVQDVNAKLTVEVTKAQDQTEVIRDQLIGANDTIEVLEQNLTTAEKAIDELNATITKRNNSIRNLAGYVSDLRSDVVNALGIPPSATIGLNTPEFLELADTYIVSAQNLINEAAMILANADFAKNNIPVSAATVDSINLNALFGTAKRIYVNKNDGHQYGVDIAGSYNNTVPNVSVDADSTVTSIGGPNYQLSIEVNGERLDGFTGVWTLDNAFNVKYLIDEVANEAFTKGFNEGFEAGYDKGFQDGFEQGYNEGYNDGFADGVASVVN